MKYTYRNECLISNTGDRVCFIVVAVLICCDAVLYLVGLVSYLLGRGTTFLVCAVVMTLALLTMLWSLKTSIGTRRKAALARRRTALSKGIQCAGKIVDAGKDMETEQYEDLDEHNNRKTYYRKVQNYWIDVEYIDPLSGKNARTHQIHMVRSMKHLIGCNVSVYVWEEWSDYSRMEFTHTYVDTYNL